LRPTTDKNRQVEKKRNGNEGMAMAPLINWALLGERQADD
jgi:hypothetical protein